MLSVAHRAKMAIVFCASAVIATALWFGGTNLISGAVGAIAGLLVPPDSKVTSARPPPVAASKEVPVVLPAPVEAPAAPAPYVTQHPPILPAARETRAPPACVAPPPQGKTIYYCNAKGQLLFFVPIPGVGTPSGYPKDYTGPRP